FGFNCERVVPLGARRVRIRRWFWFPPSADEGERRRDEELVAASDQVMGEDIGMCEAVQRNLEAGRYEQGVLSPAREPGTIFFQRLVRESLAAMP
ncbi:MAG: SRPBCC family protein, partial [Alphaproteobacteria bacterium]